MNTLVFIMGALILALAALAVYFWRLYRREYYRRWDEISRAFTIEKESAEAARREQTIQEGIWNIEHSNRLEVEKERERLQNKLSDLLCPTNNHIWKDGKCIKCGRRQHELD